MKLKTVLFSAAVAATGIFFTAFEEEAAKPTINLTEVGLDNSGIGYIGDDLHVEADIVAEGTINTVSVELHSETNSAYEIDTTYSEFNGLKNATFHKHLDIPSTFEPGDYHLHLIVVDKNGNQTVAESEVELQQAE